MICILRSCAGCIYVNCCWVVGIGWVDPNVVQQGLARFQARIGGWGLGIGDYCWRVSVGAVGDFQCILANCLVHHGVLKGLVGDCCWRSFGG